MTNNALLMVLFWILFNQKDGGYKFSNCIWASIASLIAQFITGFLTAAIEVWK